MNATASQLHRLAAADVERLDPYAFMAVIGKRVIHPGGRAATEQLLDRAQIGEDSKVVDVGCGVGTTAIMVAERFGADVTAVDIEPIMLQRAESAVEAADVGDRVHVRHADILALDFPDDSFDVVIAEAVTMFVDRSRAAHELIRVCRPGGRVLATEFMWRRPPSEEAREIFLGQVCPGLRFDTADDWVRIYTEAGLSNIELDEGPFEMMSPKGFVQDEGVGRSLSVMGRVMTRPAYMKKMAWLMSRMRRAVPYLGYIVVSGKKQH